MEENVTRFCCEVGDAEISWDCKAEQESWRYVVW